MKFNPFVILFLTITLYLSGQTEPGRMYMFCHSEPTVKDHEGNIYRTVQIGSQCWMAENMRCTTSPTGKTWLHNPSFTASHPLYAAYYANPIIERYGILYNWAAAMDIYDNHHKNTKGDTYHRGICPAGWHLPNSKEWEQLFDELGGNHVAGELMKSSSQLWEPYAVTIRDVGGFDATPAGAYTEDGYRYSTMQALFWSSTSFSKSQAWCAIIYDFKSEIYNYLDYKCYGHSVRCVKD